MTPSSPWIQSGARRAARSGQGEPEGPKRRLIVELELRTAAIGWLDLAWRNAEAITLDLRVMAVRSGFEVLFDVDPALEATAEIRGALSRLVDEPDAPRTARVWPNRKGQPRKPEEITELEWWWMRFTFLRNAIAHGGALTDELYEHDGYSHLDLGVYRLKQAIKAMVIAQGYPELELTPRERVLFRAMRKHGIKPPSEPGPSVPD
jgi:hypothetical protein